MTEVTLANPASLPDPSANGYSTTAIIPAGARLAFISGQGGFDGAGSLPDDFAGQVSLAYTNLLAAIEGIGGSPANVAKITTFVVDHHPSRLEALTRGVTAAFGDRLPAQTLVGIQALAVPGMLFEVEAMVALP